MKTQDIQSEIEDVLDHICKLLLANKGHATADVNAWADKGRKLLKNTLGRV